MGRNPLLLWVLGMGPVMALQVKLDVLRCNILERSSLHVFDQVAKIENVKGPGGSRKVFFKGKLVKKVGHCDFILL